MLPIGEQHLQHRNGASVAVTIAGSERAVVHHFLPVNAECIAGRPAFGAQGRRQAVGVGCLNACVQITREELHKCRVTGDLFCQPQCLKQGLAVNDVAGRW